MELFGAHEVIDWMKNAKLGDNAYEPSEPGAAGITIQPHVANDGGRVEPVNAKVIYLHLLLPDVQWRSRG